jgi:hypothetical protein
MSQKNELKSIEKKIIHTYFNQDGIADLALGIGYFFVGASFNSTTTFFAFWGLAVALLLALRKKIQAPRIGLVNLSETARFHQFLTAMGLLGISLVILLVLIYTSPSILAKTGVKTYYLLYTAIVLVLAPVIVGIGGPKRFFLYQGLILILLGVCLGFGYPIAPGFLISGLLFGVIGVTLLVNFLKKHPKQPVEANE